jgi:hypothetical protein
MEQGVIRISSFTHAVVSATPHATFLDSASLHPGYNLKPIFTPRIFEEGTKDTKNELKKIHHSAATPQPKRRRDLTSKSLARQSRNQKNRNISRKDAKAAKVGK